MMDSKQQFAIDLSLMKERAMRLGLYATGQRMDVPIRMVGFEISGDVLACERYEADFKRVEK
jgi:hypothetical protein